MIVLALFAESFCFDFKCAKTFDECWAVDLMITNQEDKITMVNGNVRPLSFIKRLYIRNGTVNFIPMNMAYFFPNLIELEISDSHLKWIEQANIRDLKKLKLINFEKNDIQALDKGLFAFNKELEKIIIRENKLGFVHKDVFLHVHKLRSIDIAGNVCTNDIYENHRQNYFSNFSSNRKAASSLLDEYCHSALSVLKAQQTNLNKIINDLVSKVESLSHQLKTCDGNLDAALKNIREMKLNLNSTRELTDRLSIDLQCKNDSCTAVQFKVPFTDLSIENERYKEMDIKSLTINEQQALFLPRNLGTHFPRLNELSVIHSGLSEVNYQVFRDLQLLVTLNLTDNKLSDISVDTFEAVVNLRELDLSFNHIRKLHDDVFARLKRLEKLNLQNNLIESINGELLKYLINLKSLSLQANKLNSISANLLTPFAALEMVDLSGNICINTSYPSSSLAYIVKEIEDNCISPVELYCKMTLIESKENNTGNYFYCTVDKLSVEYPKMKVSKIYTDGEELFAKVKNFSAENKLIKYFPYQLSKQLPNLESIYVRKSKLISLQATDFDGFSKLTELVFKENSLATIMEGTFDTVPGLMRLDLSSNDIVSLPNNIFATLINLHTLLLSNNRITRFIASYLPQKNSIDIFRIDENKLKFIETKTIRYLKGASTINLTRNDCINSEFIRTAGTNESATQLAGEVDFKCSEDNEVSYK